MPEPRRLLLVACHPGAAIFIIAALPASERKGAMGFLDKVKVNIRTTASKAREGVEELQTKRELGQAYGDLGRRAFDLIEAGKLHATELDFDAEQIRKLKASLEAGEQAAGDVGEGREPR